MKWIDWYGPIALLGASKSAWKGWVVRRYAKASGSSASEMPLACAW